MHIETELDDPYAERLLAWQRHDPRPLPELVADLLKQALAERETPAHIGPASSPPPSGQGTRFDQGAWLDVVRPYIKAGQSHDMAEIRAAIARGWQAERCVEHGQDHS
ncbi:hypothetical protein Thiowin_03999 [Thiorhodovibrio winogradskyi]|uniref:Uncharacterized protein n=1 Tax=Thiorhodovibrio winogradskyi TaxID=77007 RepID=A0ABZ0SD05_9GAMM|nr:hypothetical protein [Thiorhodovibrio winogradskyi]